MSAGAEEKVSGVWGEFLNLTLSRRDVTSLRMSTHRESNNLIHDMRMTTRMQHVSGVTYANAVEDRLKAEMLKVEEAHGIRMISDDNRDKREATVLLKRARHLAYDDKNGISALAVRSERKKVEEKFCGLSDIIKRLLPPRDDEIKDCCNETPMWLRAWTAMTGDMHSDKQALAICGASGSRWSPEPGTNIGNGFVVVKRARMHVGVAKVRTDTRRAVARRVWGYMRTRIAVKLYKTALLVAVIVSIGRWKLPALPTAVPMLIGAGHVLAEGILPEATMESLSGRKRKREEQSGSGLVAQLITLWIHVGHLFGAPKMMSRRLN